MSKTSVIHRNLKREVKANNSFEKRAALKAKIIDPNLSFAERMEARDALNKMPRDTSKVRVVNRCEMTGRPHAVYRKFKICRIKFRELASDGKLPGVTKASW